MSFNKEGDHFEGKIEHTTAKSWLVNTTLGDKYWCPKKCCIEMYPTDAEGNHYFLMNKWWSDRRSDFEVKG